MLRRAIVLVVLVGLVRASSADPRPSAAFRYLRGPGAEACPDEAAARADVVARLGYDPFDPRGAIRVTAEIRGRGGTLRAVVTLRDETGRLIAERELASNRPDCLDLAAATDLAISIAIDPLVETRVVVPASRPAPDRQATRSGLPATAPASQRVAVTLGERFDEPDAGAIPVPLQVPAAPVSLPRRGYVLMATVGPSLGEVPGAALATAVEVALDAPRARIGLEADVDWPITTTSGLRVGSSAGVALAVASAVPCLKWRWLRGCAVASLGSMFATGRGLVGAKSSASLYAALGVRAAAEVPLGSRLALALQGDLAAPVTPTSLVVGAQSFWRTPPLDGALGAGVTFSFP